MIKRVVRLKHLVIAALCVFLLSSTTVGLKANSKPGTNRTSDLQLIMFKSEGCHYCQKWDSNIGVYYHKTPEGKFAPLRKVDIYLDDDVANIGPVVFTPTFVLYKNGQEVGRLIGYISEDFFWGLLSPLLRQHGFGIEAQKKEVTGLNARIK